MRSTSLLIGLCNSLSASLILALLTVPLLSLIVVVILARGHLYRGVVSSLSNTTSPSLIFRWGCCHFFLLCRLDKYSRLKRDQKIPVRYCTLRHRRLRSNPSNWPGGESTTLRFSSWFGVRALRSPGWLATVLIGRELMMHSTSHSRVLRASSSRRPSCSVSSPLRIWRTDRIRRSHEPPMWLAVGGLNLHSML